MSNDAAVTEVGIEQALPALQLTLDRQRAAFLAELPVSLAVRRDRLDRGLAMLIRHRERLHAAIMNDFPGRPAEWTSLVEIFAPAQVFAAARKNVHRWMRDERRKAPLPFSLFGARARIQYQPLGVVGIMSAWNAPLNLVLVPLATTLAAGNRAMLCPSDQMPNVAAVLDEAVRAYFAPEELAVAQGGLAVCKAFSQLQFDHLMFTGSSTVGAEIAATAGRNLVPVTLELGGKCPVVIAPDADLDDTAQRLIAAKTYNGGQACLAPDHLFVPRAKLDALRTALDRAVAALYPGGAANSNYCAVVSERHYQRLQSILDEARQRGADIQPLGLAPGEAASDPATRRLVPHLVIDAPSDTRVMRDELFGPVMVVSGYDEIEAACRQIVAAPKPLGLYVFAKNPALRRFVLDRTFSGGVTENDALFHYSVPDLPFGGVGRSGIGAYSFGIEGFRRFSHARAIYTQAGPRALMRVMQPPYGRLFDLVVRGYLDRLSRRVKSAAAARKAVT